MANEIKDEIRKIKITEMAKTVHFIPENKNVLDSDVTNLLYYFELIKEYDNINESA